MARGFGGETTEQEARGIDNSAATDSSMASVASGRADAATSAALGGRDVDPGGGGDNDEDDESVPSFLAKELEEEVVVVVVVVVISCFFSTPRIFPTLNFLTLLTLLFFFTFPSSSLSSNNPSPKPRLEEEEEEEEEEGEEDFLSSISGISGTSQ